MIFSGALFIAAALVAGHIQPAPREGVVEAVLSAAGAVSWRSRVWP